MESPIDQKERAIGSLTPRERACLELVYKRRTTKEIAIELGLSTGTVFRYIRDAQTKLDAPNRRRAAEILMEGVAAPIELGGQSDWVDEARHDAPPDVESSDPTWIRLLPFRVKGVAHNELTPSLRIAWIFIIALVFTIGFGMLAVGAKVVSDLARAWF